MDDTWEPSIQAPVISLKLERCQQLFTRCLGWPSSSSGSLRYEESLLFIINIINLEPSLIQSGLFSAALLAFMPAASALAHLFATLLTSSRHSFFSPSDSREFIGCPLPSPPRLPQILRCLSFSLSHVHSNPDTFYHPTQHLDHLGSKSPSTVDRFGYIRLMLQTRQRMKF